MRIDRLIVISGTQDGQLLQVDAGTGEIRSLAIELPPRACGAVADVAARELVSGRLLPGEAEFDVFRIDADAGKILWQRSYEELVQAAGIDAREPVGSCPMVLAGDRLYVAVARTDGGYVVAALDPGELAPVDVLAPVGVVPHALVATGPLADAPDGALLVHGLRADSLGRPMLGTGRIVAFDLATGDPLSRLDLDFDAPHGTSAPVVDRARGVLYVVAHPSLLVVDLNTPGATTVQLAASPGPLALGDGVVLQAATGVSVQQPGPGLVYMYGMDGMLVDSADVSLPSLAWPPFMRELGTDATGERLYIHAGTGEGGLFYDLQRARVLIVDIASRSLLREIPLEVWPAGQMLLFF
jgi:outer membrane protein assembly factor BamB